MLPIKHAVILGVSSDIGINLAQRLLEDGWRVSGFARDERRCQELSNNPRFSSNFCDLDSAESIVGAFSKLDQPWSLFVSCAGTMTPIGRFFDLEFDKWERAVTINVSAQLRFLHTIWPIRTAEPNIMFLAGGGTNKPFPNYSAYCVSKIALIKMCELIQDENPETNTFIIGPGYMRTRIHEETLTAGKQAGKALDDTQAFLDGPEMGTTHDDLYAHLRWCLGQGREVAGGRNFSTVHDPWRDDGSEYKTSLIDHPDALRLRRHPARK